MSAKPTPAYAPPPPDEGRNAKGEWRPSYGIKYAPLLAWPWKPFAVLKWIVTYPGFAWPVNSMLLAISAASWFLTQPFIAARWQTFNWDWMLLIFLRNQALIWMFYGSFYLWLYIWKKEGTKGKYDERWPSRNTRA
jgi:hypothetical protein